jgi:hypothetical protein
VGPDDREQVFPTPALAAQRWRSVRRSVHEALKAACTAGDPTLQTLEASDGTPLDGRSVLADGTDATGVVRLAGPVRDTAVEVAVVGSGVAITTPMPLRIAPGQTSAPFTLRLPTGATGQATVTAILGGSRLSATIRGLGLAPPQVGDAPLAGRTLFAGEPVAVIVGLSGPASEPEALALVATGAAVTPPTVVVPAGQRTATVTFTPSAGVGGAASLGVRSAALSVDAAAQAVALRRIERSDGSQLDGATVFQGSQVAARVALTGAAPRAIDLPLSADAGLGAPGSASVVAGQGVSAPITLAAAVAGARTVRASLFGQVVGATVNIVVKGKDGQKDGKEKDKEILDEKSNAKDVKELKDDPRGRGVITLPIGPAGPVINRPLDVIGPLGGSFIRPDERPDVGGGVFGG